MIKAYIYGTPKGFDTYGSNKSVEGYLRGFYITSRRGKRLMVNRRANGETIYSYLHYGLMEYSDIGKDKAGRINSFFGMSLHISDGIYTPDLKRVFDWFDYWFNKILEDGTILKEVSSGYIQYQVSKFANANNIEHLHSNLPNIFSEKSGTIMLDYDDSFVEGKSGQIAQLNNEEDDDVILSTFKHYQWVALSPIFKKIEKSTDICIELDFNDLNDRLAEYNKMLLPIAINLNARSVDELSKINDVVQENCSSITSYLKAISNGNENDEECNKFASLASDYVAVCENIAALKLKFSSNTDNSGEVVTIDKTKTQFCYNCQEHKDVSEFSSPDATKCIACEEKIALSQKKQCYKCGQTKSYAEFESGSKICKVCESKKVSDSFVIPFWAKIAVPSAIVLVIVGVCLLKFFPKATIPEQTDQVGTTATQTVSPQKVDDNTFETLIKEYKYQEAYDYLADKSNKLNYLPFDDVIKSQMWEMINNNIESYKTCHETLVDKILVGITPLGEEVITKGSKDAIIKTIEDFGTLVNKLALEDKSFGPNSYEIATDIITDGKYYNSKWSDIVASKYDKYQKGRSTSPSTSATTQQGYGSIYLVHLDGNYNPIKDEQGKVEEKNIAIELGKKIAGGTYKRNTFVDICYDRDKVRIRRTKVLEDNTNPTTNPQAQNYKLNATHRVRIDKAGRNVYEVIYVEDLTGKVLMEITIKTKQ